MIREFKEIDLNSIMKLWLETNIAAHSFIDENYWKSNYDNVKQMMPEATIVVYEENNSIKGFIGLSGDYIAGIFVETLCQSKGVGKALLNHIKERNQSFYYKFIRKIIKLLDFISEKDSLLLMNKSIKIQMKLNLLWNGENKQIKKIGY